MIRGSHRRGVGVALLALGATGLLAGVTLPQASAQTRTAGGATDSRCEGEACFEVQKRPTTTTTGRVTTTAPPTTTASPPTTASSPSDLPPFNAEVCVPPAVSGPPSSPGGAPTCAPPSLSTVETERLGEAFVNPEPGVSPPLSAPERPTVLSRTGPGNRLLVLAGGAALMVGGLGLVASDNRRRRSPKSLT